MFPVFLFMQFHVQFYWVSWWCCGAMGPMNVLDFISCWRACWARVCEWVAGSKAKEQKSNESHFLEILILLTPPHEWRMWPNRKCCYGVSRFYTKKYWFTFYLSYCNVCTCYAIDILMNQIIFNSNNLIWNYDFI